MRRIARCVLLIFAGVIWAAQTSEKPESSEPAIVAIKLNQGRVMVPARVNGSAELNFLLDTACTIPTLHPTVMDELGLSPSGRVRIYGIAGLERAPTYRGVVFQLNDAQYEPRRVASIQSEREESRRRRDGVLDSGFFERFVVEIDTAKRQLRLYSPEKFTYKGEGEIIEFRFKDEIPVVTAQLELAEGNVVESEFEIDTGCDSGICLGEHFVREHQLAERLESRASEKFGVGGAVRTEDVVVPALRLGNLEIREAQADLFLNTSPVDKPLAGHIGMGVLGKYRLIMDYGRKRMIMEE